MAITQTGTGGIKDDAVTDAKLANAINSAVAANTAKDLTALSAANLTSGTIPDARFPATLPAASAANLTAVPAANITGTLPAISAANLTNVPAANITGTLPAISGANLTNLPASGKATNLIINGSMQVAQRLNSAVSSSTDNGYGSVDRFRVFHTGVDENPTHEQADVAAGTTPYTLGFRKCLKVTNGNQTGGAGAADYIIIRQTIEAQDIANSGWNYVSASSNITFSFWVKSSVAQNFYGNLWSQDGTEQNYIFETGSLSANTWTKVTKTIPGNSNLTFDNDTGAGLRVQLVPFYGTDKTGSVSLNTWAAFSGSTIQPDNTSTWYTTNDATLEITGVLLEVADSASDYPHETFAENLAKCQRYFYMLVDDARQTHNAAFGRGESLDTASAAFHAYFPCNMRTVPTVYSVNTGNPGFYFYKYNTYYSITGGWYIHGGHVGGGQIYTGVQGSPGENIPGRFQTSGTNRGELGFIAEF